jgi:muramoyltetrapeptide carboxypeptidase
VPAGPSQACVAPQGLADGATIGIVAPAHPVDRSVVQRAVVRLSDLGFRTKIVGDPFQRRGYLAGPDSARAEALMAAYRDPQVDAIFCAKGGCGATRLLGRLDFDVIRAHPKILIGFSDITALLLAVHKQTGQITFHGPNLYDGLGNSRGNLTPFTSAHLWPLVCRPDALKQVRARSIRPDSRGSKPVGMVPATIESAAVCSARSPFRYDVSLCGPNAPRPRALRPGRARGRLTGGNLSLIAALMGTPWEIETAGRILLLEDEKEAPYRVDRYLCQLRQAGKLDGVAGVILGTWSNCTSGDSSRSLSLETVFSDYFAEASYPVLVWFPFGHERDNATWPIGGLAELNTDDLSLTLIAPPIR